MYKRETFFLLKNVSFSFFIIKRMSAALSAKRFVARHFLRSSGIISSSSLSSLSSSSLSRFSTSGSFPSSTSSSSSESSSSPEEDDKNNNNNNKDDDDDKEKNVTDKTLLSSFFALVHKKHPKDVPNDNLEKLQKHFPSLGMTEFQSKMNGQFGKKIGMSVKERKRIMQYLNKFKNGLFKI